MNNLLVRTIAGFAFLMLVIVTSMALGAWVAAQLPIPLMLVIIIRLLDKESFSRRTCVGMMTTAAKCCFGLSLMSGRNVSSPLLDSQQ